MIDFDELVEDIAIAENEKEHEAYELMKLGVQYFTAPRTLFVRAM